MHAAYREVGSYRAAADICGTTPKTVKRSVEASKRAESGAVPGDVRHNYDGVVDVVAETVTRTKGRITAKRLLPVARAAGYSGSARNFRRLVADVKGTWKSKNHRGRRPGIWTPGDMVVFDWGEIGPLFVFCAVLGWSRFRFVYFSDNLGADATMGALAECFETIGGVPKAALTDRMGCLKGGTVAGLVIPTPAYVRFATHYGFRPDFCEGADPESKGLVENLVGYVKSDLMIPEELSVADLATANAKARLWCEEVNAAVHSEICAVPAQRLETERALLAELPSLRAAIGKIVTRKVDRLSCVRFGSARYSVPNDHIGHTVELRIRDGVITVVFLGEIVAEHLVVSPGETSINDDH
jgi:transposase